MRQSVWYERIVERDPKTGRNKPRDLTGVVCNKLTIIENTGKRHPLNYPIWRAKCECGNVIERPSYRFTNKRYKIRDCGCGPLGRPRIPDNGAHINAIYSHTRHSAKQRGLEFALTKDEVRALIKQNCRYCDAPPSFRTTHKNLSGEIAWNGIDRINSDLGYVWSNCAPCCPRCNFAKGDLTVPDFYAWVERIARHLPNWAT